MSKGTSLSTLSPACVNTSTKAFVYTTSRNPNPNSE